ncbi:stress response protein NST1 [Aplysia californica]|uniref:Stress response protein NST1 n=1 Tax=Aplysia californica TaxID=6500 RepID=A0ABM0JLT3_APLCA|nr:stress response protein NST1 [Aplysia californica]
MLQFAIGSGNELLTYAIMSERRYMNDLDEAGEKCFGQTEYGSNFVRHNKDAYWSFVDNSDVSFRRKKSGYDTDNIGVLKSLRAKRPDTRNGGIMNARSHSSLASVCSVSNGVGGRSGYGGSLRRKRGDVSRMSSVDISSVSRNKTFQETGGRNRASSMTSSLSDVTSVSSISSGGFSTARENTTSRLRQELHRGSPVEANGTYQTPLQRKEKELKELRNEFTSVLRELEGKDTELENARQIWEEERKNEEDDRKKKEEDRMKSQEELERRVQELEERLRKSEEERKKEEDNLFQVKEELTKLQVECADLKKEISQKERQFEGYYLDTYRKGLEAARFEREEELEMLVTKGKSRVSMEELSRKLFRTEKQLAKWQSLRLAESYHQNNNNVAVKSDSQAVTTLAFLKDAFFHFLCDPSDAELHLKAITGIFQYSDAQNARIKRAMLDRKKTEKKKIFNKKQDST